MGFGSVLIATHNEHQASHHPCCHLRRNPQAIHLLSDLVFSPIPGFSGEDQDNFFDDGPDGR